MDPFGSGGTVIASSSSGDLISFSSFFNALFIRAGYVSGQPLSTTATFAGNDFSTLGVTPGTYVASWGSGDHKDTYTLLIGPDSVAAARVPAPANALLFGIGVVAAAVGRARRSA